MGTNLLTKLTLSSITAILALVGTGCTTQTRLGYIIPAHKNSEQGVDEIVLVNFVAAPTPPGEKTANEAVQAKVTLDPSLVAVAAGVAIDFVKDEIEKEADKYESKFSRTIRLSTDMLKFGTNKIILSRWVTPDKYKLLSGIPDKAISDYTSLKSDFLTSIKQDKQTMTLTEKKELACLVEIEIFARGDGVGPFYAHPSALWISKTKAKVVDFKFTESWKVWQLIGTALFKTESSANVSIDMTVNSLVRPTNSNVPQLIVTSPSGPLIKDQIHNLDLPKKYTFPDESGFYFDVPIYSKEAKAGFFNVTIDVVESDASNVKQKLKDASKKIDEKKEGWIDQIKNGVGSI